MSDAHQYIEFYLSGGAANADPAQSLGGLKSSHVVLSQQASGLSNVTGVSVSNASGNATGAGTLTYTHTGTTLSWAQNGGAAGAAVDVSAGGDFWLEDADGIAAIKVNVTPGSLPGSDQSDALTISHVDNDVFDNISGLEGYNGMDDYRWLVVGNTHGSQSFLFNLWIAQQPTGAATLEMGLYTGGVNSDPPVLANENTAPVGGDVVFSSPADEGAALSLTLAAGDYVQFCLHRNIAAGQRAEVAADFALGYSVLAA